LWVVTYAPHKPEGSTDKLYEITPDLVPVIRPESIGGTPANRMIHSESKQLLIGPYLINETGGVRVIPYQRMYGRHTGTARHLTDPTHKVVYATMEEGFYEVDVQTLEVKELWADEQRKEGRHADLPGYHGKGFYSGQGRYVYANNGDHVQEALFDPTVPSGALAEWDGQARQWTLVRRNQFTEVTGPGGLYGNPHPELDPVWSIGWDHRSLILEILDHGKWSSFRLPKGSHSYDGAHGWNTEWPRIRDIGENALLMTMHGTFWAFPGELSSAQSAGIVPRSNYLKVIGDFCRWNDRLVFGCDDTARSEFLNQRKAKGDLAAPGRSQSNLWFTEPQRLDTLGPALGRGAVWLAEEVKGGVPSDAYLFSGYSHRILHLAHQASQAVTFTLEVDIAGDGHWKKLREVKVPAGSCWWTEFTPAETGAWIRIRADRDCPGTTAFFHYRQADGRLAKAAPIFDSLASPADKEVTGGWLHVRGEDFKTLRFVAGDGNGELGCYDLDGELNLRKADDPEGMRWTKQAVAIPPNVITLDAASVLYVDEKGRWRLPKGDAAFDRPGVLGEERVCREVVTERDLFNAAGTFYELPAENAGGFAKIRPIATHNRRIKDYASYRGLLVIAGVGRKAAPGEHVVLSDDGKCALWVGVVDDLWQLGKPRGRGGPWKDTAVQAGQPSDPFLMTGYDKKRVVLSHNLTTPVKFRLETDISGTGVWATYRELTVAPGQTLEHIFPNSFSAYWVRLSADKATTATATFFYD
jgi:hypothetical protein